MLSRMHAHHIYFIYFLLSSNHFTHSFLFLCASFCVLPRRTMLFFHFLAYSCQSHQFRCRNSLCVNRNHLCDGIKHCTDGTDELAENCGKNNVIIGKLHPLSLNIFHSSSLLIKPKFERQIFVNVEIIDSYILATSSSIFYFFKIPYKQITSWKLRQI